MRDFEAEKRNIGTLLDKDNFFRVPPYQRPFSWNYEHFSELISDLLKAPWDQEYFLGTVVLHAQNHSDKNQRMLDVVDGQQRLTSLLILLACLRDRLDGTDTARSLQKKINQEEDGLDDLPEKIRLEVRETTLFNEIVKSVGGTLNHPVQKKKPRTPDDRYKCAVNVFAESLDGINEQDKIRFAKFLSLRCQIIELRTAEFDDAFRLFSIINNRGRQLRESDIIKAINIDPKHIVSHNVRERLSQKWEQAENELGEDAFSQLLATLRLVILKKKNKIALHKEFDRFIFEAGLIQPGEEFLDLLETYVGLYRQIFIDKDYCDDTPQKHQFSSMIHIMNNEFDASEWKAPLLWFAKKFGPDHFYDFCMKVEKLFLIDLAQAKTKDGRYPTYTRLLEAIQKSSNPTRLVNSIELDLTPVNEKIASKNFYSSKISKYILLRMEVCASELDQTRHFSSKSVEHVLPQQPSPESEWAAIHDLGSIDEYVNSIGNLVLLSKSKNSSAGTRDFEEKKTVYLQPRVADFPRCSQLLALDRWDRETIEQRTTEAQTNALLDP